MIRKALAQRIEGYRIARAWGEARLTSFWRCGVWNFMGGMAEDKGSYPLWDKRHEGPGDVLVHEDDGMQVWEFREPPGLPGPGGRDAGP